MASLFKILSSFALITMFSSELLASAVCVSAPRANLRFGPSRDHTQTWEVFTYMPFKVLGERGGWLRVQDVDGDIHWMARSLTTTSYKCAVVKASEVRLRSSPEVKDTNLTAWSPAKRLWTFKILERRGAWVHGEDAIGRKAWVHGDYLWIP